MFTFFTGEQKTATVVMTNPTSAPFSYEAMLFIGIDAVSISPQSFQLAAGEERSISFPITMPSTPGTYPVYIRVSSEGLIIALYQSVEDIQVVAAAVPSVTIMLKNPPSGANMWGLSLYDSISDNVLGATVYDIYGSAVLDIPATWTYPLRFWMSVIQYNGGVTTLHEAQSYSSGWSHYVAEFIPAPGVYYYNVTTGKFELVS